jgi:hypothetical protein
VYTLVFAAMSLQPECNTVRDVDPVISVVILVVVGLLVRSGFGLL